MSFQRFIGHRSEPVTNVVEKGAVRKLVEVIGDPNPLYIDEEAAKASQHSGLIAPPCFPHTFEYGEVKGLEPLGQRFIHGEHWIRYEQPLFVGGISCSAVVKDYY